MGVGFFARALRGREGLSILASGRGGMRADDERTSLIAVDPVDVSNAIVPDGASSPAASPEHAGGYAGRAAGPRWIGVVPYEAFRGLERGGSVRGDERPEPLCATPRWLRYDACLRICHDTGRVAIEADDARAADALRKKIEDGARRSDVERRSFEWRAIDDDGRDAHAARVRKVLDFIRAGDVYQVNLARRLRYALSGDRLEAFLCMMQESPVPYGFFAQIERVTVMGASPELALEVQGRNLRTCPIKGTRPRGDDATSDEALARSLDADEKERAELTMAVDLHRNDLGRVAVAGSVRVLGEPRIVKGARVMSRVAEIIATRRDDATLEACVRACLPCGSVTGAPKIRAMDIIAELEPLRRGLYTGAYGHVGRDDRLCLAMAIRTAVVDDARDDAQLAARGNVDYFTGGGIVWGSDPQREEEETRWKAAHLERLNPAQTP
jgi:anthranilate/para-aminobenzoate synthase component I